MVIKSKLQRLMLTMQNTKIQNDPCKDTICICDRLDDDYLWYSDQILSFQSVFSSSEQNNGGQVVQIRFGSCLTEYWLLYVKFTLHLNYTPGNTVGKMISCYHPPSLWKRNKTKIVVGLRSV